MKERNFVEKVIFLSFLIVVTIQVSLFQVKDLQIGKLTIVYENANGTQNQTFYSLVPLSDVLKDASQERQSSIKKISGRKKQSLNIGLAIYYIEQFRGEVNNGILIGVTPILKKSSILVLFSHNKIMKWRNIRISYIIANRKDIYCGSLMLERQLKKQINDNKLKPGNIRNYINTRVNLQGNQFSKDEKKKIVYFISAIQCNVSTMGIFINPGKQQQLKACSSTNECSQFYFSLRYSNITKQFEVFNITYIVYSENGIIVVRILPSYLSTYTQYLNKKEDQPLNQMVGMLSFNGTNYQDFMQEPIPYYREKDRDETDFYQRFNSMFEIQQIQFIYRQNLTLYIKKLISNDPKFQKLINKKYISYNECVKNKGQVHEAREMGEVCAICGENEKFNPNCLKCECKQNQNYALVNDQCLSIQQICNSNNSIYRNGTCYEKQNIVEYCRANKFRNFNSTLNDCDGCILKFIEVKLEGQDQTICVPNCKQNFYYDIFNDNCLCLPGYTLFNQTCIQSSDLSCGPMYKWSQKNKRCQCLEESVKGQNGECLFCSTFEKFNKEKKVCQELNNSQDTNKSFSLNAVDP